MFIKTNCFYTIFSLSLFLVFIQPWTILVRCFPISDCDTDCANFVILNNFRAFLYNIVGVNERHMKDKIVRRDCVRTSHYPCLSGGIRKYEGSYSLDTRVKKHVRSVHLFLTASVKYSAYKFFHTQIRQKFDDNTIVSVKEVHTLVNIIFIINV